jgi:hypothetical protein
MALSGLPLESSSNRADGWPVTTCCVRMDQAVLSRHMGDLPRSWDGIGIARCQGQKRR